MCIWEEKLSHDYDGKRFVVDGDIIELYAYEYGKCQTGVAEQFHAEPLEAYESEWLHDWTEHHDNMLRRTCDALESENDKLRELFSKVYGYYVSGTLTPCDFCDKYCCEGDAPTTCKSDEYEPDGIVADEVERLMRELGIEG